MIEISRENLIDQIRKLAKVKCAPIIGIDGMAAAGKSTLAEELASLVGGCVVHMDDFFLPEECGRRKGSTNREAMFTMNGLPKKWLTAWISLSVREAVLNMASLTVLP